MQIIIHDLSARTGNSVTFDGMGCILIVMAYTYTFSVQDRCEKNGVPTPILLYTAGKVVLLVGFV